MIQDKRISISLLLQISSESLWQEIIASTSQYGKTKIKDIMKNTWCFFTIWNLKSAVTYKYGWVLLFLRSVYIAISKLILLFSYSFHVPCIIFSNIYFHNVRYMFSFLFYWSQSKASAVNQKSHLFFEAQKYFVRSFQLFEDGHIHNITLMLKITAVSTLSDVVNINVEIDNVDLKLFNVVSFNVDIHNVVSTLIWHCLMSQRHVIQTTLRPRWKVSWVLANVAKRLHNFVKFIKLETYIFSRIPLNCCFRKLSKGIEQFSV